MSDVILEVTTAEIIEVTSDVTVIEVTSPEASSVVVDPDTAVEVTQDNIQVVELYFPGGPSDAFNPNNPFQATDTPSAPANLIAAGQMASVALSWTAPGYWNHSHTEIFRNTVDDRDSASVIAGPGGYAYSDPVDPKQSLYYWIRFVSLAGVIGPFNDTLGTLATTGEDPSALLTMLQGQLDESKLAGALASKIEKIAVNTTDINSEVTNRGLALLQEIENRDTAILNAITQESSDREQSITLAVAIEEGNRNAAVATEQSVRISEDAIIASSVTVLSATVGDMALLPFSVNEPYLLGDQFQSGGNYYEVIVTQSPPNVAVPNGTYYLDHGPYVGPQDSIATAGRAIAGLSVTVTENSALAEDTTLLNTSLTLSADGVLTNAGTGLPQGQVTPAGLNVDLTATATAFTSLKAEVYVDPETELVTSWSADTTLLNNQITIGSNGVLNNAGGGQVTLSGLGGASTVFVNETFATLADYNVDIPALQAQADASFTAWFYSAVPTLANAPASSWPDEETRDLHVGDVYYDKTPGFAYVFIKVGSVFSWDKIEDQDTIDALANASTAQDTADSKRRVFVSQPTGPYDIGDLWDTGTGNIKRATASRASGYLAGEWTTVVTAPGIGVESGADVTATSTAFTTLESEVYYDPGKTLTSWSQDTTLLNNSISIGSNGVLSGAGGGQVTADGLGNTSAYNTFVGTTYPADQETLTGLIDGKIDTWFSGTDPSLTWIGTAASHAGDMWWDTGVKKLRRYSGTAWSADLEDQKAIDAFSNAATAQDTADGKRRVFVVQPSGPYDIGDLWDDGTGTLQRATANRVSGFLAGEWSDVVTAAGIGVELGADKTATATAFTTLNNIVTLDETGLVDQVSAQSSQLTQLETYVGPSANWVTDEYFRKAAAGDYKVWPVVGQVTYSSTAGEASTSAAIITANSTVIDVLTVPLFPARKDTTVYVQARIKVSAAFNGTFQIGATEYNSSESSLSIWPTYSVPAADYATRDVWVTVTGSFTPSSTSCAFIKARPSVRSDATTGTVTIGHIWYSDAPRDGNSAIVQQQASSIDGIEAQYTVKLDVNGHVSGYGLIAELDPNDPGQVVSEMIVRADKFSIVHPDADFANGRLGFSQEVVGGVPTTVMDAASIVNLGAQVITMTSTGHIKGGQTAYNTGSGYFLGYSGGYKFSLGTPTKGMTWNGTDLAIVGAGLNMGSGKFTVDSSGNVDARAITIRDSVGNVLMASGTAMDYSKLGGTKPPSNATNGATFGTNIGGQITAATASTYIADLAVNTIHIAGQAVTFPEFIQTPASIVLAPNNPITVQTLAFTITTAGLGVSSVLLDFSVFVEVDDNSSSRTGHCSLELTVEDDVGNVVEVVLPWQRVATTIFLRIYSSINIPGQVELPNGSYVARMKADNTITDFGNYSPDCKASYRSISKVELKR